MEKNSKKIENLFKKLLTLLGEDPLRPGLLETPSRIARMYKELVSGYETKPESIYKLFESESYNGVISITDINFHSLCEHHLLPFYGQVHIGYIPGKKILGLSKFARLVDIFAKRLQVQERLTSQIANSLHKNLNPVGVIVVCQAKHLCMSMRGIKKEQSQLQTIVKKGIFETDSTLVNQFLTQIGALK